MSRTRLVFAWVVITISVAVPVVAAATSPLLAWREPIYILAGLAGVLALVCVFFQPLLAGGYLPGIRPLRSRKIHRWLGAVLVVLVTLHVLGLWITSPPDVIDALLFASPTPFSIWGVIAMWAVFVAACLVALRRRLRLRPRTWSLSHRAVVAVIVVGSVVHALLIDGTMEIVSKAMLCGMIMIVTALALVNSRIWSNKQ